MSPHCLRKENRRCRLAAERIEGLVDHDPVQPGAKGRAASEPFQPGQGPDERFLRRVPGRGIGAADRAREPPRFVPMPLEERVHRRSLTPVPGRPPVRDTSRTGSSAAGPPAAGPSSGALAGTPPPRRLPPSALPGFPPTHGKRLCERMGSSTTSGASARDSRWQARRAQEAQRHELHRRTLAFYLGVLEFVHLNTRGAW